MNLTEHFTTEELERSATALERGIDNTIPQDLMLNVKTLAQGLERVRDRLGSALHINSGYRCEELNQAVRGVKTSAHCEGWAADFTCPGYGTPLECVKAIVDSTIPFDQCICEGTWVHISLSPTMRRLVMTATFDASGTVHYSKGV